MDFGYLATLIAAVFGASAALTAVVRSVARRRGWLAHPRPERWHRESTALFGGVGIYLAFVGGVLAVLPLSRTVLGLIGLTTLMFLTGLIDDARELRPQSKLVVQVACGLLLYVVGYHFNDALPWWLDLGIVVFWVVAITNAMNLLDNMNGLAAGIAVIAGVFRLLLYLSTGNVEGALAASVFIGAVAGFLVFNFPRASVFMGDTGSFTIGFVLAALNLTSSEAYAKTLFSVLIFPVLVLAIPIFDTAFVAMQRYFSGRAVSQGGRDHTSHRLVAVGLSETAAVLILWAISIAAGGLAMILYDRGFSYGWFGGSLAVLGLILFGVVLSQVRVYPEGDQPVTARSFLLPGELRYKRQMLWIVVDVLTIIVSLHAAMMLIAPDRLEGTAWINDSARLVPSTVAVMLLTLFVRGMYRVDWQDFGVKEVRTIVGGAALGVAFSWLVEATMLRSVEVEVRLFAAAWGSIVLGLCGTRVFVRTLDEKIRA
jgi:UDP-GlcNAc:undecaprenyl-phosphate GlcNAc-1-phosphate transferase